MAELFFEIRAKYDEVIKARQELARLREELDRYLRIRKLLDAGSKCGK